ncbi:hypothetical protein LNKW23_22950 [Paralimibaculum aggregatum]|uniref:PDZ domain-containing protein n=1 Tax=Paralimibaculum aggregatum TaxID=3036245 RepID=A0ABQ6LJC5_9RHOB|nr:hypothetical protein [Limibaculum sp. NKW23]GMG83082.1 hypothetical protein LNKW23_22950 [Limibaculum sp. NKW23]
MRRTGARFAGALLVGLAWLAGAMPSARAEIAAEYYDDRGLLVEEVTLYPDPAHRALLLTTATGQGAGDPVEREALRAWLESLGVAVTELGPESRPAGGLAGAVDDWIARSGGDRDAGLLVVIDSRLAPGPEGLMLAGTEGRPDDPAPDPVALAPIMEALDASDARHVLVAFTAQIAEADARWGQVSRPGSGPGWLGRASVFDPARQALVPWSAEIRVMAHLVAALAQSPEFGALAPEHADPDAFVTAADLASAGGAGLALWSFGRNDRGGEFVLTRHGIPERRFDGRPTVREAYADALAALRLGNDRALGDFLRDRAETPWHRAARRQDALLQARLRAREGERCDAALGFDPAEILSLNAGVLGRLDAFADARELGRHWLEAVRAATGLGTAELAEIEARCARAETAADAAPERALRLAMLAPGAEGAMAAAAALAPSAPERTPAAVLAALRLLAEGSGTQAPASVLAALDRAADSGSGAARLLQAVVLFDGTYRPRDTEAALAALAEAAGRGVPLADALRGAVLLSAHRGPSLWRAGRLPDREAAAAAVRRAEEAGIALDPALRIDGLEVAALRSCERRLAVLEPEALLDPAKLRDFEALDTLLNRPAEALAPALAGVPAAGLRAACARLPEPAGLDIEERLLRDRAAARLALLDLAEGAAEAARLRLDEIDNPDSAALLLAALAAEPAHRPAALASAAAAGAPLAELGAAVLALEAAGGGAERQYAIERLKGLADRGVGIADALIAAALFEAALIPPGAEPARRATADRALVEGLLRALAAERRGVPMVLGAADIARLATRAPAMLGFALGALEPAHRRLLGAGLPPRAGGLVLASSRDDLAPGDVVLRVAGIEVAGLAAAEDTLFKAVLGAVFRGGGTVAVELWRGAEGQRSAELALPPHLADIALPSGLR